MTQINRVAVPVTLARKHWDTIISVIEPEFQRRGKDWLPWGGYMKQAIQAKSTKGASPEDLATVTLAEDNWKTINGMVEANCCTRSPEWGIWAGTITRNIQAAIESAKAGSQPAEPPQETINARASESLDMVKPIIEPVTNPEDEMIKQAIADLQDKDRREAATRKLKKAGVQAVEPLLASLKGGVKFETELAVREILGQVGSPAVDALLAAFETAGSIELPRIAAEALGKIGDARAVEPLIGQLLKANGLPTLQPFIHERAQFAARALGKIGDERAIQPLIQMLEDSRNHELIRGSAIQALGELKAVKATDLLITIFNQGRPNLARQAARALGRIGGDQVVQLFIYALKSTNADIRANAASGLKAAADLRAVEPLIIALKDPSWLVRNEVIRSLGALGDKRAVDPIIALLDDPKLDVKWSAVMELGGFKDNRALPGLELALHAPEMVIRRSAAKSLGQIGDSRAVDALIAALTSPLEVNAMNSSQEAAAEALGSIGDASAIAPLTGALQHSNPRVKEKAARALEKIGTLEALSAFVQA
jgi:HEAT repeat protein